MLLLLWWGILSVKLILCEFIFTTLFFVSWHFLYESFCHASLVISCQWIYLVKWWIELRDLFFWLRVFSLRLEKIYWCFICRAWGGLCFWTVREGRRLFLWHKLTCRDIWEIPLLLSRSTTKSRCRFLQYLWWISTLLLTISLSKISTSLTNLSSHKEL